MAGECVCAGLWQGMHEAECWAVSVNGPLSVKEDLSPSMVSPFSPMGIIHTVTIFFSFAVLFSYKGYIV